MEATTRALMATQYTGSNGADVLSMCQLVTQYSGNVWSISPDTTADMLVLIEQGTTTARWPVAAGVWVVVGLDFGIIARLSDPAYKARYRPISNIVTDAVAATSASIVKPAMYSGFGMANLPSILLGATVDVPVPILPAQADTGYVASAFVHASGGMLATASIIGVTNTSTSLVTVRVRNVGLGALSGGLITVHISPPSTAVVIK